MAFTVAIVGRPNAGKSTLFNRLIGRKQALVSERPGMTRDIRDGDAQIGDLSFRVLDTAGHEEGDSSSLSGQLRRLTGQAIGESHACLFVIDARAGLTAADYSLASVIRRAGIPVVIVANKAESGPGRLGVDELWELGLGEPVAVSAEHGIGMGDIYRALRPIARSLAQGNESPMETAAEALPERPIRIAVIGRPNVGKSTLINKLIGKERLAAGPESGLTRDSITVPFRFQENDFLLVDTAGLRRRKGARGREENLAAGDALRAVRYCEVVVLLLDAKSAFEQQDLRLASLAEQEGRAVVVALNKWDLIQARKSRLASLSEAFAKLLPELRGTPLVPVSALNGKGVDRIMAGALEMHAVWQRRVGTGALNRWLEGEVERHPPKAVRGRRIRLRYLTQTNIRPPTFALFASRPRELDTSYRRFLVNGLRDSFGFAGVPLRLMVRGSENPYITKR